MTVQGKSGRLQIPSRITRKGFGSLALAALSIASIFHAVLIYEYYRGESPIAAAAPMVGDAIGHAWTQTFAERGDSIRKTMQAKSSPKPRAERNHTVGLKSPVVGTDTTTANMTVLSQSEEEETDIIRCEIPPIATTPKSNQKDDESDSSCAILFFGLPRSFKLFVLPSIMENIILPNVDNHCDYYLHYHTVEKEGKNRRGEKGGKIYGSDVFLLEDAIRRIHQGSDETTTTGRRKGTIPHLSITNSSMEDFERVRGEARNLYETTLDENGKYLYFPWRAASWAHPMTLRNMLKQWHSIDAVWQHMEENAKLLNRTYSRVAMLRNDVVYVTPFDIYQLPNNERDLANRHFVIPGWAGYPVNDRMVAGPYDAVKIWATERFSRVEKHVRTFKPGKGWGIHSERFMNFTILPAMRKAGGSEEYISEKDPNLCFLRARVDGSVWIEDCKDSFETCDMAPVVLDVLAKHHRIVPSGQKGGIHCQRKSIDGIKFQDVVKCEGDATFLGSLRAH